MGEYYGNNDFRSYLALKHYGVKGMKWHHHKYRDDDTRSGFGSGDTAADVWEYEQAHAAKNPRIRRKKHVTAGTGGIKRREKVTGKSGGDSYAPRKVIRYVKKNGRWVKQSKGMTWGVSHVYVSNKQLKKLKRLRRKKHAREFAEKAVNKGKGFVTALLSRS